MTDMFDSLSQRRGQVLRPLPVALKQMKRHPLRRLWPNAGQALKRFDKLL